MKNAIGNLMLTCLILLLGSVLNVLQAQPPARETTQTVIPLDAKTLNLNTSATATLNKWKTTKNMMLKKDGNFVPMAHSIPSGGQSPNSFASGGTNCAKIECPPVFGPDVVCWECH